jgi:ribonuclease BN (tRNA processing enzyme)
VRLTVLGGSGAGTNTGQGCSGYLVDAGGTRLVLDLGPGTLLELRRHADFRTLDGVVLSHLHVDHTLDLVALRFALAYNPVRPPGPLPLWLPPGGRAFLDRVAAAFGEPGKAAEFFPSVFAVHQYDPHTALRVGEATLRFAPTVHYVPCWAIRVETPGAGALGYTADAGPTSRLDDLFAGVEVLVAEGNSLSPSPEPLAERGHLTATEAGELAARVGAGTLVLTHLWEENGFDAYRDRAAAAFTGRLELATPGLRLAW